VLVNRTSCLALLALLALGTSGGVSMAQTGTGGAAPSGGTSGGAASPGTSTTAPRPPTAGAPALAPTAPATQGQPGTTTNTDVFPPSRVLQSPAPGAASPTTAVPNAASQGQPTPGQATSGAPGQSTTGQSTTGQSTSTTPQTDNFPPSGGRPQAGGANSSQQSVDSARTGKNPMQHTLNDCIRLWDPGTHMTKQQWRNTCARVQNRLNNIQVDTTATPKSQRRQGALTRPNASN